MIDGTTKKERAIGYILANVKDEPSSLELWGKVVYGYCAQWSNKSYTVMVNDYYLRGRVPGGPIIGVNGQKAAPTGMSNLQKMVEAERAKSG